MHIQMLFIHKILQNVLLYLFHVRYERELRPTRLSSIRQGAMYGAFVGWMSLVTYITYSVGFIFGTLLISHDDRKRLDIGQILIVSDSSYMSVKI